MVIRPTTSSEIVRQFADAVAVDMESYGVARAVFESRRTVGYNPRLLIVRGISDLVAAAEQRPRRRFGFQRSRVVNDGGKMENDEQRQTWKPYAAAAAATFAAAVISRFVASPTRGPSSSRETPMDVRDHDSIAHTPGSGSCPLEAASEVPQFEPPFDFKIRWAPDYDSLFRDRNLIETEPEVLLERAFKRGRVLLQSAGGTGKTSILSRLRRESPGRRIVALYIDLRRWRPEMFEAWEELRDSEPQRLQLLFDTLTGPSGVDDAVIDQIGPEFRALLMVDGLNEVPSGIGDSIISAIDAFARRHPRAGVIATDRLVRRPISDTHWTLVTIAPLDGRIGLDGVAFFRNLALTESETSISSADAYRRYLAVHADMRDPELAAIGEAALSPTPRPGREPFR